MFPLFSGDCQIRMAQFPHFGITVFARNRSRQFREPKHPNFPNGPRPERICPCHAIARERQQIAALDGKEARGFVSRYKRFSRHSSQVRRLRSSNPTGLGRHFSPLSGRTRGSEPTNAVFGWSSPCATDNLSQPASFLPPCLMKFRESVIPWATNSFSK